MAVRVSTESSLGVTVVGGGIAGLVAAISCAEAGVPVRLYEARKELGGRARSSREDWKANFGPHALCRGRANWTWLKERDLLPKTAWISPTGSRFHYEHRLRRTLPTELLAALGSLHKQAPADRSFADWGSSELGSKRAGLISRLAAASFSYHHNPGELSAAFVWPRISWLFAPPAVHRVIGGWNVLVDLLAARASELSVEIHRGVRVNELPSAPVILALELEDAAALLGRELTWPSAGGVAMDIGLVARRGDPGTIIDLDHGVLVQGQHHSSAPQGHRLYQAHVGVRSAEERSAAQEVIEEVLDRCIKEWRSRIAWRRKMNVVGCTGAVDYPGTTWRDRPAIAQKDGVFLAGDRVAADGLLSEVSFNSAIEAARLAQAWVGEAQPATTK